MKSISLIYLLLFGILPSLLAKDNTLITLFDTHTLEQSIKTIHGGSYSVIPEGLNVKSVVSPAQSGILIAGSWNLSSCKSICLEVTNLNTKEYLPLTIQLNNPKANISKLSGLYLERIYIPASTRQRVILSLPDKLPHPEVRSMLKGMRRDPFYQWGSACDIDLTNVVGVAVYVNRAREDWQWQLHQITVIPGKPEKPYSWMLMDEKSFFPFIDRYGQFKHKEWPGKTHSDKDLVKAYRKETQDLKKHPGPTDRSRFGGWSEGPRLKSNGHFRIEKYDGKWWLVDPDGYLFWSHGVVRVTPSSAVTPLDDRERYFEFLPEKNDEYAQFYTTYDTLLKPYYDARHIQKTFDFSAANIRRKYGLDWRNAYAIRAQLRLKSWGLNTIANSSDRSICLMRQTPYTDRIELKSPVLEGSKGSWWKFRDPFHPDFRASLHRQLLDHKHELDDPWCLGFFVDNEINWGEPETLGIWTLMSPSSQPAKLTMVNLLAEKYHSIEALNKVWNSTYADWNDLLCSTKKPVKGAYDDCKNFSLVLAEAYFKNVREVFKQVAPSTLYLGCRFARSNPMVIHLASKYCDVLSYNIYKRNVAGFVLPDGIDKPVIIGEFHCGALDRGLFHPGLIKTADQKDRAACYADYVTSALKNPFIIGTHWHQFADQATTGRFDGENFQVGFVDVCDLPYWETIEKVREVGYHLYQIRKNK